MRRTLTALIAALVVVSAIAAVPALGALAGGDAAAAQEDDGMDSNGTDGNGSLAPGERLTGVVGLQEAELDGEVEARSFGLAVANADSDERRAAIIAEKLNDSRRDVEELEQRRDELREARENAEISEGQFRARMAELDARSKNVERIANESANASAGLPAELLEEKGINTTAIQTLRDQARNLTGPEVADVARDIAGERRQGQARAPADRPGPAGSAGSAGNATDGDERPGGADRDGPAADGTGEEAADGAEMTTGIEEGADDSDGENGAGGSNAGAEPSHLGSF